MGSAIVKVVGGVAAVIVLVVIVLMLTLTAAKLDVATVEVGALPPASPPAEMSIGALPTGTYYKPYDFEGGPYLGFPRSHDVWGDGSVVIVPAPGHTPDSVVVFVNLPSGTRYALVGDLVWQMEGLEIPAEKPWPMRRLIGEDDDEVHKDIALIRSASTRYPQIHPIPAHEASAFRAIPVFPASAR